MIIDIPEGTSVTDAFYECWRASIHESPVSFRFDGYLVTIERDDAKPPGKIAGGPMGGVVYEMDEKENPR